MKVSVRCDYAVTALIYLVIRRSHEPATLSEISQSTHISSSYLEIILSGLRRASILRSGRGPKAGFYLGDHGADVSIADVARAVDPEHLCFEEIATDHSHIVTNDLSQSLHKEYVDRLEQITIAKLIKANQKYIATCRLRLVLPIKHSHSM